MVAAGFEYIVKAYEIALHISVRIGNAVAHPGLCCEVNYHRDVFGAEDVLQSIPVGNRSLDKFPASAGHLFQFSEPAVLDIHVIIVCDRVNSYHSYIFIVRQQAP